MNEEAISGDEIVGLDLTREERFFSLEGMAAFGIRLVTYSIVVVISIILVDIVAKGASTLSYSFLFDFPRRSGAEGGILPAIVGTLCLVVGAIVASLPIGVATAIYLTEYAKQNKFTSLVRLAIVTLSGVPSVVFGLFGLGLFVVFLNCGASIMAGSLTLACMILPTIVVSSEEALRTVPKGLREASLALGATKWQTIRDHILPSATPGMLTGAILGVGRVAGETAPILLTAAAFFLPRLPRSIFDQVMALPYHLYILATQHPDTARVLPRAYGTALVLLIIVLGLSTFAVVLRSKLRKRYRW